MKILAVTNDINMPDKNGFNDNIYNYNISFGLFEVNDSVINIKLEENRNMVMVKVKAFSLNYRDKALIVSKYFKSKKWEKDNKFVYSAIGSEFSGDVIEVGDNVTEFKVGDRVMSNCSYYMPYAFKDSHPGVPTNNSSKEIQLLHFSKLKKVPESMSYEEAAAFPIGAITSQSMVRKLNIKAGENILVTSAISNTSLFAINALMALETQCNVYALTTSKQHVKSLLDLGVKDVILIENNDIDPFNINEYVAKNESLSRVLSGIEGFDCIIDPLLDVYLGKLIYLIMPNGRYISCGFAEQVKTGESYPGMGHDEIMTHVIIKNISLIGNCLGIDEDYDLALNNYISNKSKPIIDSVYSKNEGKEFINRTFNSKKRFGKVVLKYN